jgi:hypothetical protein
MSHMDSRVASDIFVGQILQSGILYITDRSLSLCVFSYDIAYDFIESLYKDVGQKTCIIVTSVVFELFFAFPSRNYE